MTTLLPYKLPIVHTSHTSDQMRYDLLLGGRGKAVAVCDCDGHWSVKRLHAMLSAYVIARIRQTIPKDRIPLDHDLMRSIRPSVEELCQTSLGCLHIYRPTSSISLAATLTRIGHHRPQEKDFCMLIIDGISSFYWPDRWKAEQAASVPPPSTQIITSDDQLPPPLPRGDSSPMEHIIAGIQSLRIRLGLVTIITNWILVPPTPTRSTHHPQPTQISRSTQNPRSTLPPRSTMISTPLSTQWRQLQDKIIYPQQHLPPPYPSPFIPQPPFSPFTITHHLTLSIAPASTQSIRNPTLPSSSMWSSLSQLPSSDTDLDDGTIIPRHVVAHIRTPVVNSSRRAVNVVEGTFKFRVSELGMVWMQ